MEDMYVVIANKEEEIVYYGKAIEIPQDCMGIDFEEYDFDTYEEMVDFLEQIPGYNEQEEDDYYEDGYDEMGFNPYLGGYDYDC